MVALCLPYISHITDHIVGKLFFYYLKVHSVSHQLQHVRRPKALIHKAHLDTHKSCLHAETCSEM